MLRVVAFLALLCIPAGSNATSRGGELDLSVHDVPLERIVRGGPHKDGVPAISSPRFVAADDAGHVATDDMVVGLTQGDSAKAYPLEILARHEVVNDEIAGLPIAVSYCPLTASATAFDRRPGALLRTFAASGLLYEGNLLLYDHETRSLWSQLGAVAITGPSHGTELSALPVVVASWAAWRAMHPTSSVLAEPSAGPHAYRQDPYREYANSEDVAFPPSRPDTRLPAKERVLGVMIDGHARAYPFSVLARKGPVVHDVLAGRELTVTFDGSSATARSRAGLAPAVVAYWFAWSAFHADTTIWRATPATIRERGGVDPEVRIESTDGYWTTLTCGFASPPVLEQLERSGLYVVSGSLRNVSAGSLAHVRILFELIDESGAVVYREEGYNRAAEVLMDVENGLLDGDQLPDIAPIPPDGTDSYRMIFVGAELPAFDHPAVSVVGAE